MIIEPPPIGLSATGVRIERDSMGEVEVPADRYWGAQTQRSLEHFAIGVERMPVEVIHAFGLIKRATAEQNADLGVLARDEAAAIAIAAEEVAAGELDDHFPLFVWQTGSGTQTNMNANEVIGNRAIQLLGGVLGSREPVHPNNHVNSGQSSNDTFVTAMHVAAHELILRTTIPTLTELAEVLARKSRLWSDVVKIGRTHLQDATPITVGQEWSAFAAAVSDAVNALTSDCEGLLELAIGGTAVGTGLNAPAGFGAGVADRLAAITGSAYRVAANPFAAQSTLDRLVRAHSGLRGVAIVLYKIANDLRWLGSGPRSGLGELRLPENEPGSSIMPGKVNPTQCEAMLMVCTQVLAADVAVGMGGAEGTLQLNVARPMVIYNVLQSARNLAAAATNFRRFMVEGIELNHARLTTDVANSVMAVTALAPHVGYDLAATIAHDAVNRERTLRESALAHGVSGELFDEVVRPADLTGR